MLAGRLFRAMRDQAASCLKGNEVDEPLYGTVNELSVTPKAIEVNIIPNPIDSYTLQECLENWNAVTKKIVLVGVLEPNQIEQQWLDELSKDDSVIVLTETTSNLHHDTFFPSIDQLIAPLTEEEQTQQRNNRRNRN